jgi:anthranilate phosphoribosyltransferase
MAPSELTRIIKDIGRGKNAARDLSRDDARALFAGMLAGDVPDLQLGAVLMALRIKGESLDELTGFLEACEASYAHLTAPAGTVPLVIPAYNGARQLPNLTPLLALLVAREGVPVLIHGVRTDAARVTTCEVLAALGVAPVASLNDQKNSELNHIVTFIPLDVLAPPLARLLALRNVLGVRSSGHTVAKLLQPFTTPAVRLTSVTHPEYVLRMREFFTRHDRHNRHALLLRGAEGEAVAHPRRAPQMEWLDGQSAQLWEAPGEAAPVLPASRDAQVTAAWIREVLDGRQPIPAAIAHQAACCVKAVRLVQELECTA